MYMLIHLCSMNLDFFLLLFSRETYWANFATGLGASLHELGHTFDLAHTPTGIMARGFDDIHRVFTVQRSKISRQSSEGSRENSSSSDSLPKLVANISVGSHGENSKSKHSNSGSSGEESASSGNRSNRGHSSQSSSPSKLYFKNPIRKVRYICCWTKTFCLYNVFVSNENFKINHLFKRF